ncbi:peptidyl-tRNA hydrolase [Candidatus Dojkabacteria bacterium]|jgi:PTH2 family peptidyl-tRNA hydrolase|nr:peptidyl-tRNA hydrolase [Candidatus Dojkabacteria bacterium]
MREPKQVLIWRADLRTTQGQKVRTGKICVQLAHASLKAILDCGEILNTIGGKDLVIPLDGQDALCNWITGIYTKVAVVVNSEQELVDIYNQAVQLGIPCSLIVDHGLTEFGGVENITAAAVGPASADVVDSLTGHLKLL